MAARINQTAGRRNWSTQVDAVQEKIEEMQATPCIDLCIDLVLHQPLILSVACTLA